MFAFALSLRVDLFMIEKVGEIFLLLALTLHCPVVQPILAVVEAT
jgi:hypothetical protein